MARDFLPKSCPVSYDESDIFKWMGKLPLLRRSLRSLKGREVGSVLEGLRSFPRSPTACSEPRQTLLSF